MQKGIYEYSRARAGHYAKVLFSEPGFQAALEKSRWSAYPLGLAMVAETGRRRAPQSRRRWPGQPPRRAQLTRALDLRPISGARRAEHSEWNEARRELERRLGLIGIHPAKPAKDIPEPFVEAYFALLPIDKKLRASEFPTIRNYLRVSLCNIHDEFSKRAHAAALVALLSASRG